MTFYVDNTAPTAPLDVQLEGSAGWRATNSFDLKWKNPPQSQAPIAGAAYRLCPTVAHDGRLHDQVGRAEALCRREPQRTEHQRDQGSQGSRRRLVGRATVADRRRRQPAAQHGIRRAEARVRRHAAGRADLPRPRSRGSRPDSRTGRRRRVGHRVRIDRGPPRRPKRVAATGDPGRCDRSHGVHGRRGPAQGPLLPARPRRRRRGLESSNDRNGSAQPATLKLPIRLGVTSRSASYGRRVCRGHGKHRRCRHRLVDEAEPQGRASNAPLRPACRRGQGRGLHADRGLAQARPRRRAVGTRRNGRDVEDGPFQLRRAARARANDPFPLRRARA